MFTTRLRSTSGLQPGSAETARVMVLPVRSRGAPGSGMRISPLPVMPDVPLNMAGIASDLPQ